MNPRGQGNALELDDDLSVIGLAPEHVLACSASDRARSILETSAQANRVDLAEAVGRDADVDRGGDGGEGGGTVAGARGSLGDDRSLFDDASFALLAGGAIFAE